MADNRDPVDRVDQVLADPRIRAAGVLFNTSAMLERLLGAAIQRETGISHSMFEVLLMVAAEPAGAPMSRLSGGALLTSGGATRLVDRMVEAGLVTRAPSAADRRVQLVSLTEHGRGVLLAAAAAHTRESDRLIGAALSADQAGAMVESLDLLGRHLRTEQPPLR
ncbi:MarR family transcriptional regulator [Streptomyces tateyamensis]|uniref:MarR family transcriptional regulator n=1 Tax=Streptomyces tateyamensis TaxID=565073 RepID=A0A2V4N4A7_9ACTN|nr:MarR family winged helix-turn-helix transcriptional regulator [Streptomyces tateyamensis]PYC75831.1 MarR family transcriptional regulator [Streptomyces tateyamensis]